MKASHSLKIYSPSLIAPEAPRRTALPVLLPLSQWKSSLKSEMSFYYKPLLNRGCTRLGFVLVWAIQSTLPIPSEITRENALAKVFCGCCFLIKKNYAKNMKKLVGTVQKLPAKQHSQTSPFPPKFGCIGCAIQVSFFNQCSKMQLITLQNFHIQTCFSQFLWFFSLKC